MRAVKGHRISFWGYAGDERVRRNSNMADKDWGWDATCSCGWDSKTGGAIMARVDEAVAEHKAAAAGTTVVDELLAQVDAKLAKVTVAVWGPNLGHGRGGEAMHIHSVGCADTRKGVYVGHKPWTIEVSSYQEIVEDIYGDMLDESEDSDWRDYAGDVRLFPCTTLKDA